MSAYEREYAHTLNMQQAYLVEDKPMSNITGPVNCNVANRRRNPTGAHPRSCARCTLGPCPFYERSDASPDGYAETSRYGVTPGGRLENERMGYTNDPPAAIPFEGIRNPPAPINAKSSEAELIDAMSAALLATMSDHGLRFAPADEPPAALATFEHVADAFATFFNDTGHGVRHQSPGEWARVFRDARANLRAKLSSINPTLADCIDWAKAEE